VHGLAVLPAAHLSRSGNDSPEGAAAAPATFRRGPGAIRAGRPGGEIRLHGLAR